jgi:flavin reductase (DIM6/NTAB) family NADH-FMN oxidoreductase RutF
MSLYCKVTDIVPLGSHDMFIADIAGISVDERLLDASGKLCLDKAGLAAFAHGEYFELGKKIGTFGFSVAKKKRNPTATKKQPPKSK